LWASVLRARPTSILVNQKNPSYKNPITVGRKGRRREVMGSKLRGPRGPTKMKPKRTILRTGTVTCNPPNSSESSCPTLPPMSSNHGFTKPGGIKSSLLEHAN